MACCLPGCPCPSYSMPPGPYYLRLPEQPCCICELDDIDCSTKTSEATPHRHWLGHCDCECDPEQGGQTGEWSYTYDSNGNYTGRSWSGECDPEGPTPDWDSTKCQCHCQLEVDGCDGSKTLDTSICECICPLTDDDCSPPTPSIDTDTCECVCNTSPGDCTGSTPDFNSSLCECYCALDNPSGGNYCPESDPYLNTSTCECYCPSHISSTCTTGQYFDSSTCSCKNCSNVCNGSSTRVSGSCDCYCPLQQSDCGSSRPYLDSTECRCYCPASVSASCTADQIFDANTCSCVYDSSKLSISLEP